MKKTTYNNTVVSCCIRCVSVFGHDLECRILLHCSIHWCAVIGYRVIISSNFIKLNARSLSTLWQYFGETVYLMIAAPLCLGWSITERTLAASEQLIIAGRNIQIPNLTQTAAVLSYFGASIGVAFGGDNAALFLVLTAFLRTVIAFVLLVGAQATIVRVSHRYATDNRSMMDQQRNVLVMLNLHYRMKCML